jgi:YVTN family beta-propeller protein
MAYVSTPYVWVANSRSNNVTKLDSATGEVIGTYNAGDGPWGIAIDASGNVWVANYISNNVTKLNGSTGAVIGTYNVGKRPWGIAVDVDGNVWVSNNAASTVTKLNGSTGAVIGTYNSGSYPTGIAIYADNNIWIANNKLSPDNVTKLDGSTGLIINTCSVGDRSYDIAVDFDGNVWTANYGSDNVTKLNGSTGAVIGSYNVGTYPNCIAVDADNNIWVSIREYFDNVVKLNGSTGAIMGVYSIVDTVQPRGISIDVDGNTWVADFTSNNIVKLNGSAITLAGTYNTGDTPYGVVSGFALQRFTLGYHLPISSITISPDSITIPVNSSKQFESTVSGGDGVSGVAWSAPDGGIVADGLFTPPAAAGTYRVVATSVEDESKNAAATVTVVANHVVKFGNYSFPKTFHVSSAPSETKVPATEIPRRDGVAVGVSRLKEKNISIKGMLRADTPNELRAAMDNLLAAVNAGRQRLYLWDDRYIWATKTSFTTDYDESSFERYAFAGVDFLCDSPFWESTEESTDIWANPWTTDYPPNSDYQHSLMVGGNAYTMPTFKLTVSGTGALYIKMALGIGLGAGFTEARYFTLKGDVTDGDVIVVDCGAETVTLESDGSDCMSMFDSSFFPLCGGGSNTFRLIRAGSPFEAGPDDPVISQVATTWRNRWY